MNGASGQRMDGCAPGWPVDRAVRLEADWGAGRASGARKGRSLDEEPVVRRPGLLDPEKRMGNIMGEHALASLMALKPGGMSPRWCNM